MAEMEEERRRLKEQQEKMGDVPLDDMLDCEYKYKKVLERFKEDGQLYEDKKFPPNDESLGEKCKSRTTGWKRADSSMIIHDQTINAMDVQQGSLGDCYFLSAISVLGEENVKKCIKSTPEEIKSGVMCIRFFRGGEEEEYIVIDNHFPVYHDQWAFVKSENGKELWPMMLEKAYAKMYGSFENIEAGKVQYALADMTGGAPEQIKLEDVENNLEEFWKKIHAYYKAGYLMGAGSPDHEMGDSAISDYGIVQGHAYAILELNSYEEEKLIKMRNPHGGKGAEWNGDWADGSPKWTEAAKAKLQLEEKEDGVFWISLSDFIFEFKNLYICRTFGKDWKPEILYGKWEGKSAAGLPSRKNKDAIIENNPHFALTVNKPCTLFLKLSQKEKINMYKGKQAIYLILASNNGKRISRISGDITVCSSYPPTDLITVTSEVVLDNHFSYPTTFTIMVSCMNGGAEGEGSFLLKVYSTDLNMKLAPMDQRFTFIL